MEAQCPQAPKVCTCNHHAPTKFRLTSPVFLEQLAKGLYQPDVPASQILYGALEELLSHHTGTLHDLVEGNPIDLEAAYADGLDVIEWAFGGDWARGVRRLLDRANGGYRNSMKATPKLLLRVLLLHYAVEIHRCRTVGPCSQNPADID